MEFCWWLVLWHLQFLFCLQVCVRWSFTPFASQRPGENEMGNRGIRPLRANRKQVVFKNPWSPDDILHEQEDTGYYVSDSGALESLTVGTRISCDCLCIAEPEGFCIDCIAAGFRGLTCNRCFGHCSCGRPICISHSGTFGFPSASGTIEVRFCGPCYQDQLKSIRRREIFRRLLPFLES